MQGCLIHADVSSDVTAIPAPCDCTHKHTCTCIFAPVLGHYSRAKTIMHPPVMCWNLACRGQDAGVLPVLLLNDESSLSRRTLVLGLGLALGSSSMFCSVPNMRSPAVLGSRITVAPHAITALISLHRTSRSSEPVCIGLSSA